MDKETDYTKSPFVILETKLRRDLLISYNNIRRANVALNKIFMLSASTSGPSWCIVLLLFPLFTYEPFILKKIS